MQGQAHWIDVAVIGLGAVMLAVTLVALGVHRFWRRDQRRLACPSTGQPVDVTLVQDERTGQYVGVARCSRFADPTAVRCGQQCRLDLNAARRAEATPGS